MYYQILETLTEATLEECLNSSAPYVAVLTPEAWELQHARFDMGIDLDMEVQHPHFSKAEVNYDSLTGSFSIPNRDDPCGARREFAFALDEKGIVFIDQGAAAGQMVAAIQASKKWRSPSLERFLYDFLEQIIAGDLSMLERYESTLAGIEERILNGTHEGVAAEVNELRGELLDLRTHYEQLIDVSQELEENENGYFTQENLRFFRMFTDRVSRLQDNVSSLRDYAAQVRDLYQAQMDARQNRTMNMLTVVTTIFLPLTLIVGWYGMNFKYMPELDDPLAYPIVIIVSVLLVLLCLFFFKKKKLL